VAEVEERDDMDVVEAFIRAESEECCVELVETLVSLAGVGEGFRCKSLD
jgi:hypothetical protein